MEHVIECPDRTAKLPARLESGMFSQARVDHLDRNAVFLQDRVVGMSLPIAFIATEVLDRAR